MREMSVVEKFLIGLAETKYGGFGRNALLDLRV